MSHLYVYSYVESFIVSSMDSVQWVCFTEENVHDFRISVVSHEIITGLEFVPDTMISSFFHEKMFQLPHNKPATYYN